MTTDDEGKTELAAASEARQAREKELDAASIGRALGEAAAREPSRSKWWRDARRRRLLALADCAAVALALLGVAAVSRRLTGSPVTLAMVFVAVGLLVGPEVLGGIDLESSSSTVRTLAEATLATDLADQLRRELVDGLDQVRRALTSLQRFPGRPPAP